MTADDELLGCILAGADPTDLDLAPGDLYDPMHESVFRACLTVADSGRRCDPQSVAAEMGQAADRLPGGRMHLVNLAEHAIPHNAGAFAARVRESARRRGLVEVAQRIIARADTANPDDLTEDARGWLEAPASVQVDVESMADLLPAFIDRVEAGDAPGLATPWADLDHALHGLHPGRLYTVGGRPGAGKSVVLTNIAAGFAGTHGTPVLFCTLEMPAVELVGRIVAATAGVAQTNLLTGAMSESDWARVAQHQGGLAGMPLMVADKPIQTLQSIRTTARTIKRKQGLGLVVVDYLQLLTPPDRGLSRQQQIGELTRGLKRLAKELAVPVLTASQLRRPADGKNPRPTMSDLRESGDIEADSDVVILLHTEDEQQPWDLEAVIAKNRSGPKGPVRLMFDTTRAAIHDRDWRYSA